MLGSQVQISLIINTGNYHEDHLILLKLLCLKMLQGNTIYVYWEKQTSKT